MNHQPKAPTGPINPPKGGSSVTKYSQTCGRCERLSVLHKGEVILSREEYDRLVQAVPAKVESAKINFTIGKVDNKLDDTDIELIAKQIVKAIHEKARGGSIV
ncbi:hypothetical protein AAXB25_14435 [Paenibacillus lautus]|uniref:hypothetical protein n=1 Tax=Paenibacillus lautus TaxID=1401 RepID=UPI003D2CA7E4